MNTLNLGMTSRFNHYYKDGRFYIQDHWVYKLCLMLLSGIFYSGRGRRSHIFYVKKLNSKGLTLMELLAVVAIMGILAAIAFPSVIGLIDTSKQDVCRLNVTEFERMYEDYLELVRIEHSDFVFRSYLEDYGEELCLEHGEIRYVDGEIVCSVHSKDSGDYGEEEESDGVPYL